MEEALYFDGNKYISSKRASEITGYAKDYVGQLCRGGKIDARRIGRNWFVREESILEHKDTVTEQLQETYAQMRSTNVSSDVDAITVSKQKNDENVVENTILSSTRVRPPVPLSEFAKTRLPTPSEIARHYGGKRALAAMNITYDDATPLYYEDDRPLNPQPGRSTAYYGAAPITHVIEPKETVGAIHNTLSTSLYEYTETKVSPASPSARAVPIRSNTRTRAQRPQLVPSDVRRATAAKREPVRRRKQETEDAQVGTTRTQKVRRPQRRKQVSASSRLQYVAAIVFFLVVAFGTYMVLGADFVTRVDMNTADAQSGVPSNELRFRDMF